MKEIFKAGFYRVIFLGFNFLVGLFIAAVSGTELFGTISLMIVNAALIQLLTGFGFDQAIVWHGAGKKISADKLFSFTVITSFLQVLLFLLISFLFFKNFGRTLLSKNISIKYYYLELIYFSGLILLEKYISLLYAQQKSKACNLILASVTICAFIFLVFIRFNVIKIFFDSFQFFCMLMFVQALAIIILFHSKIHFSFSLFTKIDFLSLSKFSGLVFAGNVIQFLAYRADYWFIDYFKNENQVGIYSQANRFAGLLWIMPNIVASLLVPKISSPENNLNETVLTGMTRALNFINLFVMGLIVLLSYVIYTSIMQQEYFNGFLPLLYMLPGYYLFSITILLAAYFSAKNLLWINLTGALICFMIIIVADVFFIPSFGIKGAAWANTIAYSSATVFTVGMFLKKSKLSIHDLFLLKKGDWKLITKYKS